MRPRPVTPVHAPIRLLPTVLVGAMAVTALLSWCPPACAQDPTARSVLTIHWGAEEFPGTIALDAAIRDVLLSPSGAPINYYAEYLESEVFPPAVAAGALHDYIARKYEGRHIDAVIATTTPTLQFAIEHRPALFPARRSCSRPEPCRMKSPAARLPASQALPTTACFPTRWISR